MEALTLARDELHWALTMVRLQIVRREYLDQKLANGRLLLPSEAGENRVLASAAELAERAKRLDGALRAIVEQTQLVRAAGERL